MAKVIDVMVCDSNGNGLSGQTVKVYGKTPVKTDSTGKAAIVIEGSVSIYVNGFQVYNGSASSAPNPLIHRKG
ncbi:hypothetical protein MHK_006098 [Candidatus Magnetomorum sp. HK-1]|nr:hypothetical protein MHK_006098 [Candidatus Magnetomorum sp. HK-1]